MDFRQDAGDPFFEGMAGQLFEMAQDLAAKGLIRFRTEGTCMLPSIHPGEPIEVLPKTIEEIQVGQVALYRRGHRIFAHRVIEKGLANHRPYIFTRPDAARDGSEGPIFAEDLLGIVKGKERPDSFSPPNRKGHIFFTWGLGLYYRHMHSLKKWGWAMALFGLRWAQRKKVYRGLARFLMGDPERGLSFSIQVPLGDRPEPRFYRILSIAEWKNMGWNPSERPIQKMRISLKGKTHRAAYLSLLFRPENCPWKGCWLTAMKVRHRYRGLGIEEGLLQKTGEILRPMGIKSLAIGITQEEGHDLRWLKDLGFQERAKWPEIFPWPSDCPLRFNVVLERKF